MGSVPRTACFVIVMDALGVPVAAARGARLYRQGSGGPEPLEHGTERRVGTATS